MAKVKFTDPIKSVSGKLSKKSQVTFMLRKAATSNTAMLDNPNFTHIMGKRSTPVSAAEETARKRFGEICKSTLGRLKDPDKKGADMAGFKAQTKYTTLRQYVWHQVEEEIA